MKKLCVICFIILMSLQSILVSANSALDAYSPVLSQADADFIVNEQKVPLSVLYPSDTDQQLGQEAVTKRFQIYPKNIVSQSQYGYRVGDTLDMQPNFLEADWSSCGLDDTTQIALGLNSAGIVLQGVASYGIPFGDKDSNGLSRYIGVNNTGEDFSNMFFKDDVGFSGLSSQTWEHNPWLPSLGHNASPTFDNDGEQNHPDYSTAFCDGVWLYPQEWSKVFGQAGQTWYTDLLNTPSEYIDIMLTVMNAADNLNHEGFSGGQPWSEYFHVLQPPSPHMDGFARLWHDEGDGNGERYVTLPLVALPELDDSKNFRADISSPVDGYKAKVGSMVNVSGLIKEMNDGLIHLTDSASARWTIVTADDNKEVIPQNVITVKDSDSPVISFTMPSKKVKIVFEVNYDKKVSEKSNKLPKLDMYADNTASITIDVDNTTPVPTSASITQQQLNKWTNSLSSVLQSVSPSVSSPSTPALCPGNLYDPITHAKIHDYHPTYLSSVNWSYGVSEIMNSAPNITKTGSGAYIKSGQWSASGGSSSITSILPNIEFMIPRNASQFGDNPTNASWVQSIPNFLQGLGFPSGLTPSGSRISGSAGSSAIKSGSDTVNVGNLSGSANFTFSAFSHGSVTIPSSMQDNALPTYSIGTTVDNWTPSDITSSPIAMGKSGGTTGSFNGGELWFTDTSSKKLYLYPEVAMQYSGADGWTGTDYTIGEKKRSFYPTGAFDIKLVQSGSGGIDSDTIAVDSRAYALSQRAGDYAGRPVIFSGGDISTQSDNNFVFQLTSYTMDITDSINGQAVKSTWGNSGYSSLDSHNTFTNLAKSSLLPSLYIHVYNTDYKMYTVYGAGDVGSPSLSNTYSIKFQGGVVTDWGGLPSELQTGGSRSMKIEETLQQALEHGSGSNPVGWYNEDTSVIVVNKYVSNFTIKPSTAMDKLNITWGPKSPLDRNDLFSNGIGAYINYKVNIDGSLPSPFSTGLSNSNFIISGELPNTRFIIPDASINDMGY